MPIQEWINQQLRSRIRETLSESRTRQRGYVDSRYVDVLLDEHERGPSRSLDGFVGARDAGAVASPVFRRACYEPQRVSKKYNW